MTIRAILDGLAAAYRTDLEGEAYVRNLVDRLAPALDRGLGVIGYTYDATDPARPVIDHFVTSERFDPRWLGPFYDAVNESALDVGSPERPTGFHVWGHLAVGQASLVPKMREFLPLFSHIGGARDTFAVNAVDASGRGLWLGAPMRTTTRVSDARFALFTRFSAHLTAALRLRRNEPTPPTAWLAPNGKLLDTQDDGAVAARDDLRRATVAFEEARATKKSGDVDRATRRWRPLVVSRWSLLDEFDQGGRRFVVAVENAPPTRAPRKDLSEREHQVMTQAHLGHADKVIAYELGLSTSTVRVLIHRATRKLGASSRREALARFDALAKEPKR